MAMKARKSNRDSSEDGARMYPKDQPLHVEMGSELNLL
jgi:hypothetical protein